MSNQNERITGSMIILKTLEFPREILGHVVSTFDPSVFKMNKGTIKMVTSGKAVDATLADLMKFSENKPGDIVVWSSLQRDSRPLFVDFAEDTPTPPDDVSLVNSQLCADKIGVILVTYLLHGSLGGFSIDNPIIPKFALMATGLDAKDFQKSSIMSTDAFCKCKFQKSVTNFQIVAVRLPMTFLSRIKLSWAGNRVFAILKMVKSTIEKSCKTDTAIGFLLSDEVMGSSPYFSTHPDHHENPFHDCVKAIYAEIGDKCRRANVSFDKLYKRRPAIFIPAIRTMLESEPSDVQEKLPTIDKLKIAFAKKNSIGGIVREDDPQ